MSEHESMDPSVIADGFARSGETSAWANRRQQELRQRAGQASLAGFEWAFAGLESGASPEEKWALFMHGMSRGSIASQNLNELADRTALQGVMHSLDLMGMAFGSDPYGEYANRVQGIQQAEYERDLLATANQSNQQYGDDAAARARMLLHAGQYDQTSADAAVEVLTGNHRDDLDVFAKMNIDGYRTDDKDLVQAMEVLSRDEVEDLRTSVSPEKRIQLLAMARASDSADERLVLTQDHLHERHRRQGERNRHYDAAGKDAELDARVDEMRGGGLEMWQVNEMMRDYDLGPTRR